VALARQGKTIEIMNRTISVFFISIQLPFFDVGGRISVDLRMLEYFLDHPLFALPPLHIRHLWFRFTKSTAVKTEIKMEMEMEII
jgi:hypothetical protein